MIELFMNPELESDHVHDLLRRIDRHRRYYRLTSKQRNACVKAIAALMLLDLELMGTDELEVFERFAALR
ncbi:MAG: hypothetical protein L0Z53_12305 [Acidobacteriales bacterium]|nr:hypothetical protein [Terriglobales bacterium]